MAEIRRHSVDVPITRTLVALRRVRSLRDPCTNSMSKFASLLENVKWETGSNNGISLQFESCSTMEELEKGPDLHKLSKRLLIAEGDESPLSVKDWDYGSHVTGVAIAELEFYTPKHVTRAEKSWKMIADSFQSVLGCNVEIRMNLVISACSPRKSAKAGASLFFGLFSCSRRMLHKSYLTTRTYSDYASERNVVTNSLRSSREIS